MQTHVRSAEIFQVRLEVHEALWYAEDRLNVASHRHSNGCSTVKRASLTRNGSRGAPSGEDDHAAARELREGLDPLPAAVVYYALHDLYTCVYAPSTRLHSSERICTEAASTHQMSAWVPSRSVRQDDKSHNKHSY